MKCCQAIKTLREKAGLSMRKMAEELGIPATSYASYEKGETDITSCNLIKIAKYHNVSTDYLLGLTNVSSTIFLGKSIDFVELDNMPSLIKAQMKEVATISILASKENITDDFKSKLNEYLEKNISLIEKIEKCLELTCSE